MRSDRPPFILVAGMHRSGTSALTGVLHLLGAALPGRLVPPSAHNPRGYYESAKIVALHDRLLAEAGSRWDKFFDLGSIPDHRSWIHEISRIVSREFLPGCLPLVKDPRICRMIPLWRAAVEGGGWRPVAVIPLRDPFEVAASLKNRDGFLLSKSLLTWLRYVLAAERDTRGLRRSFVTYDSLMADWPAVVARIGSELQIDWPRPAVSPEVVGSVGAFLGTELRHHRHLSDLPADNDLVAAAAECWSALQLLVAGPHGSRGVRELDRIAGRIGLIDRLAAGRQAPALSRAGAYG